MACGSQPPWRCAPGGSARRACRAGDGKLLGNLAIGLRKNADGVTLVTEVDANLSRRSFPGEGGGCGRERRVTVGRPARDRCRWFDRIPAMAFGRPVAFDHRRSIAIQSFNAALEYQQQGGVKPRAVQGAGARRFGWMVSWVCERAPRVDQGVGIGRLGRAALIPIHALRQILHLVPLRLARDRRPFNPSSERTPGPSPGCSVRRGRQGRWRPCGPVRGPRCRQRRNTPRPCACWGGIRSWSC